MSEAIEVKPSELVARMSTDLFLPGAFHKAECEQVAALIIRVCAEKGDEWVGVAWKEVGDFIRPKLEDPDWRIFRNPFFKPDAYELVERGYASWAEGEVGKAPLVLTPLAIRRAARSLGLLGGSDALKSEDVRSS